MLVVSIAASSCGGREVDLPAPADVPPPSFVSIPEDLAESVQLAAVPIRDVAGLEPSNPSAATEWLPDALVALGRLDPSPTTLSRLSVYEESVHFTFPDPTVPGRSISAIYRSGEPLSVSEPQFDDSEQFPLDEVDPMVPQRIREAIERRFPLLHVTDFDLTPGLSYGFGLVWYVSVDDARGGLATVFVRLDGAIVAIDAR